ncbi:MAG: hypothetical protein ACYS0K_17535 [Planctomycetota bacterium]
MLVRAIAVLLCLLPAAWAQGLQEDINEALDPRTEQARRLELLDRIDKTEGGLNQLAQEGLDGKSSTPSSGMCSASRARGTSRISRGSAACFSPKSIGRKC